jgi:CRISPR system Cascade subunit CasC
MKHLELHIIQSFPVTCLNRDDFNSPKTAIFGGVQRARVSSQSWKRAVREIAKETLPEYFKGERTRLFYDPLLEELKKVSVDSPEDAAKAIVEYLVKVDEKSKEQVKSKVMYFMSPMELAALASAYAETKDVKKAIKAVDSKSLKDGADISLFGRMVASDHSLTVEASAMFSHALSTHVVQNEAEYFSAVDDLQKNDESGAGMTGTIEFNSATYYRFAAVNLDMLKDQEHLAALSQDERQQVMRAFVEATLLSVPSARRNSMNGNTLPAYVLGIVREKGHPVQLVNAFEKPIAKGHGGYVKSSIDALVREYTEASRLWGFKGNELVSVNMPEKSLTEFLDEVIKYVE